MKHLLPLIIFFVIISCGSRHENLAPFGWEPVDPVFDSLTLELEWQPIRDVSPDSMLATAELTAKRAAMFPDNKVMLWRSELFKARALRTLGRTAESDSLYRHSLCLAREDSARYPYDVRRMMWSNNVLEGDLPISVDRYCYLKDEIEFFDNAGDRIIGALRRHDMATLMYQVGYYDRAYSLYHEADSLLRVSGADELADRYRSNLALTMFYAGDKDEALELLRKIESESQYRYDPAVITMVQFNQYVLGGDTAALSRANDNAKADATNPGILAICRAYVANEAIKGDDVPAALEASAEAVELLPYVMSDDQRAAIFKSRADALALSGMRDSADGWMKRYIELTDSLRQQNEKADIMLKETAREIAEVDRKAGERHKRDVVTLIAVIVALIVMAGVTVVVISRRMKHQRRECDETDRELERTRRRVVAMEVNMAEKDRLLNAVKDDISGMASREHISHDEVRELESTVKAHLGAADEREGFVEAFEATNPGFVKRLLERYPGLSESNVRFAVYIAMGLDNNRIARIMMVRPESVKQARWRLKSKMGLKSDASLGDAIRELL